MPFVAGAVAVLTVHQSMLWMLHARGLAPWPAYSRAPTPPFGVPAVLTAAFWGGVWGIPLAAVCRRAPTPAAVWVRSAAFGAVAPNAVGAALVASGHSPAPRAGTATTALAAAIVVNACWALAAAALMRATQPSSES